MWLAALVAVWWYLRTARRMSSWPPQRRAAFTSGVAVGFLALATPVASYAHALFSVHMVQHLLLTLVCAPLLLLGAPVTLALRAASPTARRQFAGALHSAVVRAVTHPIVAWCLFAAVMWITHLTPLYDAALDSEGVHALEHALYLTAALVFWAPVIGLDPARVRLSHPVRLAYLVLALPQQAFLALSLWSATTVLYPHYDALFRPWGPDPLEDQRAGALVMWLGGDLLFVGAIVGVAVAWMRHDEREAARIDRAAARASANGA